MTDEDRFGTPVWVDLSTPDVGVAQAFYSRLVGWDMTPTVTPLGEYVIASLGDQEVGGLMQTPPTSTAPSSWTTFFRVADVDEAVARAQRLGGTLLDDPFNLPDTTRIATMTDPTGAVFGLLGGPVAEGTWTSDRPGAVCWSELLTRDPATAADFYRGLFGWRPVTETAGGVSYTTFWLGPEPVAGLMATPVTVPPDAPSAWGVYFSVPDCAATARRTRELGGQVLVPATPVAAQRFAVLADPGGAVFNVLEPSRSMASAVGETGSGQ